MNLFILGNPDSPFVHFFALWLKKIRGKTIHIEGVTFDSSAKKYSEEVIYTFAPTPHAKWVRLLCRIPKVGLLIQAATMHSIFAKKEPYDICHIQFVMPLYTIILSLLGIRYRILILSFWGSDYYRISGIRRWIQKNLVSKADWITFANETTRNDFQKSFNIDPRKLVIARFGLAPLETIDQLTMSVSECKETLGINPAYTVVACGYNASPFQQHELIIDSLEARLDQLPSNIVFVFLLSYGGSVAYRERIRERLNRSPIRSVCLNDYLNNYQVAIFRKATDIMIHIPTSDQFSGSMQEHLYAGSKVITGSWLPYSPWIERGLLLQQIDTPDEIGLALLHILSHKTDEALTQEQNRKVIQTLSSWEACIEDWNHLYDKALKHKDTQ